MAIDLERTFKPITIALLTISDTRSLAEDTSGDILEARIRTAGHRIAQRAITVGPASFSQKRLRLPQMIAERFS